MGLGSARLSNVPSSSLCSLCPSIPPNCYSSIRLLCKPTCQGDAGSSNPSLDVEYFVWMCLCQDPAGLHDCDPPMLADSGFLYLQTGTGRGPKYNENSGPHRETGGPSARGSQARDTDKNRTVLLNTHSALGELQMAQGLTLLVNIMSLF